MENHKSRIRESNNENKARMFWDERLRGEISKGGLRSYKEFAKEFTEFCKKDGAPYDASAVSRWINTDGVRYPKLITMLRLADCLGVDLGYLLGLIDARTYQRQAVCDCLRVEPELVDALCSLTSSEGFGKTGMHPRVNADALKLLVLADSFPDFLASVSRSSSGRNAYYEQSVAKMRALWSEYEKKYGREVWLDARSKHEYLDDLRYGQLDDSEFSEDLIRAMVDFDSFIDKCDEICAGLEYDEDVARYRVQQACARLIDEIVPSFNSADFWARVTC